MIKLGGVASGFKNRDDEDETEWVGPRLFHVHGTSINDTKAVQVSREI